jgi:hypothetical protein
MPYLGDYLGHLLSEVAIARAQADLEALRIAELYASHPLLRHLPVPHFRLPTVTLDVPVAIKEMEESKKGGTARGQVDLRAMRQGIGRVVARALSRAGISLDQPTKKTLDAALDRVSESRAEPTEVAIGVKRLGEEFAATAGAVLREAGAEEERVRTFIDRVRLEALVEFLNLRTPPPRLNVLVTTAELRDAGPLDLMARFRLSLSEEALEWTVVELGGNPVDRLIPE